MCADRITGRIHGISHTARTDEPERALGPCIQHIAGHGMAALACCDEPVSTTSPDDVLRRFTGARLVAATHDVHLADWIACDHDMYRSFRFTIDPSTTWWDVP